MYIKVVFNLPIDKDFTYKKPQQITHSLIGYRVVAPFKNKKLKGVVISESSSKDFEAPAKDILRIIDVDPTFGEYHIYLAKWMKEYYHCSLGEALITSIPAGDPPKRERKLPPPNANVEDFLKLNDEQEVSFNRINEYIHKKEYKTFLLNGVTGSGKTEVYLHAIRNVVESGRQAIIIVPEISLTPQTIERFRKRFNMPVATLHSKLSALDKYKYWQMIRSGEIKIIIGARSAIFSPTKDLGMIIIDEEHEQSYKSFESPRYHARQIAFFRAKQDKAVIILGSATPTLESFYYAKNSENIELLQITKRVSNIKMPEIKLIDMKKANKSNVFPMLSEELSEKINIELDKSNQIILFLNRKGYSPMIICNHCAHTISCPNCDVSLTYHKRDNSLICHYCGFGMKYEKPCRECNIGNYELVGSGTEKVEENLLTLFPNARVARMDYESTRSVGAYEKILKSFADGEVDILIGTQMVSKGHHFPNVTLVGVLFADLSLNFPDFRAAERTFNLLTQVSGRSGRSEKDGAVYIQTYKPEHYSIKYAKNHDYEGFYELEIEKRKKYLYPPFSRLLRLVIRSEDESITGQNATTLFNLISDYISKHKLQNIIILGPSPCAMSKLQKYYRWNILFKVKNLKALSPVIKYMQSQSRVLNKKVYVEIDVDPYNMV